MFKGLNFTVIIIFVSAIFFSWLLTFIIRNYSLKKGIIDVPNARSSHEIPTPRGGGVSFVIVSLVALIILMAFEIIMLKEGGGIFLACIITALVGFVDDHRPLNPRVRLISHFMTAIIGVVSLGGLPPLPMFGAVVDLGLPGNVLAVIGVVWILNLYNFMDGIDGIASVEGLSYLVSIGSLLFIFFEAGYVCLLYGIFSAALLGFLVWNFPPAKIFMGDAGSGFIGIFLALLGIYSSHIDPKFFWVSLIMLGVFMVDATITLVVRMRRGEKASEAHRSHAYQFAARRYGHLPVTLTVLLINIIWLAPLALAVIAEKIDGLAAFLIAYLPLGILAFRFNSGKAEKDIVT